MEEVVTRLARGDRARATSAIGCPAVEESEVKRFDRAERDSKHHRAAPGRGRCWFGPRARWPPCGTKKMAAIAAFQKGETSCLSPNSDRGWRRRAQTQAYRDWNAPNSFVGTRVHHCAGACGTRQAPSYLFA